MNAPTRNIPAPEPNPETESYWKAATEGLLVVKRCTACGEFHFYPRTLCPFCFSDQTHWQVASGNGVIYSYSVMRRMEVPYALAYVTLDEGVTMMTNIVDCNFDELRIGQRVRVVFKPSDGGPPVPMFTPVHLDPVCNV